MASKSEASGTVLPSKRRGAPLIEYTAAGHATAWFPPHPAGGRGVVQIGAALEPPVAPIAESVTQFQISFCATSVALAAKLQLGSIFSLSADDGEKAVFYDAVATTSFYVEATEEDGSVLYALRHGIGVRLALRAKNLKIETNLSLSLVAAQARFSGASVFYEVQGIGIPVPIVASMLGAVPISGPIGESSYTRLDQVLRSQLPEYLASDAPLTTSEYIVVPRNKDERSIAARSRALNFGMTELARGRSLRDALLSLAGDDALDDAPARLLVTYVYSKVAGVSEPDATAAPGGAAIARARSWLSM